MATEVFLVWIAADPCNGIMYTASLMQALLFMPHIGIVLSLSCSVGGELRRFCKLAAVPILVQACESFSLSLFGLDPCLVHESHGVMLPACLTQDVRSLKTAQVACYVAPAMLLQAPVACIEEAMNRSHQQP